MGNCQAIDAATLVIQHPCGRVDKLYWPVTASEIMKTNPGHYVALLITTTLYSPTTTKAENNNSSKSNSNSDNNENTESSSSSSRSNTVRVTRVKLLRPTDTLTLGHAYRLISTQDVMKGMVAKKEAKMRKNGLELEGKEAERRDAERVSRSQLDSKNQVTRSERHRSRTTSKTTRNAGTARTKTWQPSLNSISEAGS
ncbi:hypothetical protein Ancab_039021 [Ancistrocladus abbreviatus]